MSVLYLVIPCYNEEEVLPETSKRLVSKLESLIKDGKVDKDSKILFVDDGSKDNTWKMICDYHNKSDIISGVKLSRNKGHQNALLAGLSVANKFCDCAISLDADLQDDVEVIDEFLLKYEQGCEVVYGVRKRRETDTVFKRFTAESFYKVMGLLGVDIVYNHADYRLLGKRALESLMEYKEVNLFLRGIVPLIGFKSDCVYYDRNERFAGESKYPLRKMISFAIDGISSFSIKPLSLISNLGIFIALGSILGLIYSLVLHFLGGISAGFIALISSMWFLGGIQLVCIGVVGGYVGKIYNEVKARPRFIIEQVINKK